MIAIAVSTHMHVKGMCQYADAVETCHVTSVHCSNPPPETLKLACNTSFSQFISEFTCTCPVPSSITVAC